MFAAECIVKSLERTCI